jgi:DNA-binding transcriptional ArsR family regulator
LGCSGRGSLTPQYRPWHGTAVANRSFIVYRRLTMKIDRASAQTYARWFQALSDPTRVLICNLLADTRRPMTVGEIVEAVEIGQSTVSHHLKVLAEVGFVHATPRGTARLYQFNHRCLEAFPSAAELVMGRLPRTQGVRCVAVIQPNEAEEAEGRQAKRADP